MIKPRSSYHTLVGALVALASRNGLGEDVDWADVRSLILELKRHPLGASDLRTILARVNDPAVRQTIHDWFLRAADEREGDADEASRAEEKLLAPLQTVSLGALATVAIGAAIGTIGAVVAAPLMLAGLAVAAAATFGRWRLSKRADTARREALVLKRLSDAAKQS